MSATTMSGSARPEYRSVRDADRSARRRSTHAGRVRSRTSRHHRRRARARARFAGLLLLLVSVLAIGTWTGVHVAHAGSDPAVIEGTAHVVQPGETLWGIAVDHYGATDHDIRELVNRIMAVNELASAELSPGDRLTLPYVE